MMRDSKRWRENAAKELGTTVATIKRGVNAIMFGMEISAWKGRSKIPNERRSPALEALEKEVKEARTLIVRREMREGKYREGQKATTVLSRAVEQAEVEITELLSKALEYKGWITTTLIHDEIVVARTGEHQDDNKEIDQLQACVSSTLLKHEEKKGGGQGLCTQTLKFSEISIH